jgi:predicted Zn-dependent protease
MSPASSEASERRNLGLLSRLMSKRSNTERPSPGNPMLEKAILAFRMQRLDEAERLASDVLKSNRGNVVAADVLGRALLMQNRPDEAVDPLQRVRRGAAMIRRSKPCLPRHWTPPGAARRQSTNCA